MEEAPWFPNKSLFLHLPRWLIHMAVRKRSQFLAGCWQEVLVPQLVDLSSGLEEHDTAAGLSQTDGSERERKNKH